MQCDDGTCLHPGHSTAEQRSKLDSPEAASRSLLERMGLPTGAIRNIIMHRDIVPRAFACDYTLVADLLARVGDGFREHGCLQNPHGRQVGPVFLRLCLPSCPPMDQSDEHVFEGVLEDKRCGMSAAFIYSRPPLVTSPSGLHTVGRGPSR